MKVALVLSSGFKRLAPHVGALRAYFEAEKAGKVPHPHFIIGASAGAIASTACLPWSDKNFEKITDAIINLKKSNIYSMWHLTELCGALTLGESFLNFIPVLNHDFLRSRRGQILIESGRTGISLFAKLGFFYELLKQPSIFSSEPLSHLLKKQLDFEAIWNSDIKLEIPSVDLKTAEMFYFTNYLPEHRQCPNRDQAVIDAVRGSASVAAFLQPISIGNHLLDDAAILNNIPLDRAMNAGCEIIFVIMHMPYLEKVNLKNEKITWVEELNRAIDIAIGRNTELTLQWHHGINHDLEVIQVIDRILKQMFDNPNKTTEQFNQIQVLKTAIGKLSSYGRTKTKIIPVFCDEQLPSMTFNQFNPPHLRRGIELGYRAMKKTLEKVSFS
ncbi:MAG: patatin-like phospholipase family protein [Candidatus Taylorbacteria bacterium]|nr:patatin-like phospholipase family protein [Candidatus Taylorbacteria bacterium]